MPLVTRPYRGAARPMACCLLRLGRARLPPTKGSPAAQLPADEGLTGVQLRLHEQLLRLEGRLDRDVGVLVAELCDALALTLRRDEGVGDLLRGDGHGHSAPFFEKRTVTAPRWANSA